MKAEIISIGTEILLGNIVNTDAQYLAKRLQECGISCYRQTVVGDNSDRIYQVMKEALSRCDILFVTGGLGPTADDITRETVAKVAGVSLVQDESCVEHIRKYFEKAGKELTPNNLRQAMIPEGATVLKNSWGSANAFKVEINGKTIYMLPGPPRELQPIFEAHIAPKLIGGNAIVKRQVRMFGIWESAVEEKVLHLTRDCVNPSVGIYASHGGVMLQVTASADTKELAFAMTEPVVKEIRSLLSDYVYGVDVGSLEERVVALLKEQHKKITFAESCTGGLIAKRLVDISGASEVFDCAFITYANAAKHTLLGVSEETLTKFGAVSSETAAEMAEGARKSAGADIALSVTGVAGPAGGTEEKPVGLVWFGISTAAFTKTYKVNISRYGADRSYIREYSSSYGLDIVRRHLEGILT